MGKCAELTFSQVLICVAIGLGGLMLGTTIAYSAPAVESLKDGNVTNFPVSESQLSWVASIMPLAGVIGSIFGGQLLNIAGRKMTLFSMSIPSLIGWTLITTSVDIVMVLIGRALTGISLGIAVVSYQVYLAETIHPDIRGSLGMIGTLSTNIGIVICYVLGTKLTWYQIPYFALAALIPYIVLTLFVLPETPRWYLSRERIEDARKSLERLRRKDYEIDIELTAIQLGYNNRRSILLEQFKALTLWVNLKPLLIIIGVIISGQLCGVNCIIFYNFSIFKMAATNFSSHVCSIITACALTVASFIPVFLVERIGRKILLIASGVLICISMTALATFLFISEKKTSDVDSFRWFPLLCLTILLMAFSSGYGPLPYLLMGEMLPTPIRGIGSSIVSCVNSLFTFAIIKSFFDFVNLISMYGVFWMYAGLTFVSIIFVIFVIPETKRMTLEQIQERLTK